MGEWHNSEQLKFLQCPIKRGSSLLSFLVVDRSNGNLSFWVKSDVTDLCLEITSCPFFLSLSVNLRTVSKFVTLIFVLYADQASWKDLEDKAVCGRNEGI